MSSFFHRPLRRASVLALTAMLAFSPAVHAQEYTINFRDTDINELIRFIADTSGEVFLVDPRVKGKINLISEKTVDEDELYDLFLAVLEINGYTSVRAPDGIITILPIQDAKTVPGPVGQGTTNRDNREIVIRVIPLSNISADKLVSVVRPLLPKHSHLAAYPPTNSIIIADSAANIAKMMRIIKRIDKDTEGKVDIVNLKYGTAEEITGLVEKLIKSDEKKGTPLVMVPDPRTNSILLKGGEVRREQALEIIAQLDSPVGQVSNARVTYLKHADAAKIAPVINRVIENIVRQSKNKKQARVEAHESTNSLIITAEGEVLKTIEAIIAQLDVRRAQVLVEAIIVEVVDNNVDRFGVEYLFNDVDHGLFSFGPGATASGLRQLGSLIRNSDGNRRSDGDIVARLGAASLSIDGAAATFADTNEEDKLFAVLLTALKRSTKSNVLSTPNLLTLENTEAYIVVGQNVPFVTGSYSNNNNTTNPFQTISRRDVGTTLKVTPFINEGNTVLLNIEQEVSSISGDTTNAADIVTNQRKIQTTILAANREIVVLGGLIGNNINEVQRKVPLLGDIPVVGRLFRSDSATLQKTNLFVFIRPTIIRNSEIMLEQTRNKYEIIRAAQQIRHEKGRRFPSEQYNLLPEWGEQIISNLNKAGLIKEDAEDE